MPVLVRLLNFPVPIASSTSQVAEMLRVIGGRVKTIPELQVKMAVYHMVCKLPQKYNNAGINFATFLFVVERN